MKLGFIGLGIMGKPMAKNLLKAGYELNICDINEEAVKEVEQAGGVACGTSKRWRREATLFLPCFPIRLM